MQAAIETTIASALPDRDSGYEAGSRDALESIVLALRSQGVDTTLISGAVDEALDAYANMDSVITQTGAQLASFDIRKLVQLRRMRVQDLLQDLGEMPAGKILKRPSQHRDAWAIVLPDVDGGWRIQRFDRDGFVGHMTYDRLDLAVAGAIGEGFVERDDGALDALEHTQEFKRGNFLASVVQQLNARQITTDEGDRLIAEYDDEQESAAAMPAPGM